MIQALDVASIYDVPLAYHREGLDAQVLDAFGIKDAPAPKLGKWQTISNAIANPEGEVTIAIVGKYTGLKDAYKSLNEALFHGGIANRVKVKLEWIESEVFEGEDPAPYLENVHGILVPGGFGERGSEGKILAARFARERKRALLRHLLWHADGGDRGGARSGRHQARPAPPSSAPTPEPVVGLMTEWMRGNELEKRKLNGDLGGTMRLGAYPAALAKGSKVAKIYGDTQISERHRHRYEVNTKYRERLEEAGVRFCGHVTRRPAAGDHRAAGPPLVHRRAVPPGAEVAPVRAAPAVCELHRRGGGAEPVGLSASFPKWPGPPPTRG